MSRPRLAPNTVTSSDNGTCSKGPCKSGCGGGQTGSFEWRQNGELSSDPALCYLVEKKQMNRRRARCAATLILVLTIAACTSQHSASPARDIRYPRRFVGVLDGAVALFDSTTGDLIRRITRLQPGGGDDEPVMTADGRTVFFVRETERVRRDRPVRSYPRPHLRILLEWAGGALSTARARLDRRPRRMRCRRTWRFVGASGSESQETEKHDGRRSPQGERRPGHGQFTVTSRLRSTLQRSVSSPPLT
jgi:hypothetical protein